MGYWTNTIDNKEKVTVNFENAGKKVINSKNIELKKFEKNEWY